MCNKDNKCRTQYYSCSKACIYISEHTVYGKLGARTTTSQYLRPGNDSS